MRGTARPANSALKQRLSSSTTQKTASLGSGTPVLSRVEPRYDSCWAAACAAGAAAATASAPVAVPAPRAAPARVDPSRAVIHRLLGVAYTNLEKRKLVIHFYKRYLALSPAAKDRPSVERVLEKLEAVQ